MKLVAAEFITLDGVVEGPNEWMGDFFDDQLGQQLMAEAAERDAIVLGRRTYEEMAAAWASQGDSHPMAASMNNTPKLVVSTTLDNVDGWQNSTLVKGDPAITLLDLKSRPGRKAMIIGSVSLVRSLLAEGAIDELVLLVFPAVLGRGKRLFDDKSALLQLELLACERFPGGAVRLAYRPRHLRAVKPEG